MKKINLKYLLNEDNDASIKSKQQNTGWNFDNNGNNDNDNNNILYRPKTKDDLLNAIRAIFSKTHKKDGYYEADLNIIDTSNITDMSNVFSKKYFNENILDQIKPVLDKWNTSNVTNMAGMFAGCKKFDCDLSKWDVSNVKNMAGMFLNSYARGIDNWNISNVIDMHLMFARTFTTLNDLSLANWNVSNVTNMSYMFFGANFKGDISKWDVSKVEQMQYMFYDCHDFNADISKWNVSKVINMSHMFNGCTIFDIPIGNWNVSNLQNAESMFMNCKMFNQPLNRWDGRNMRNCKNMFVGATKMEKRNYPGQPVHESKHTKNVKSILNEDADMNNYVTRPTYFAMNFNMSLIETNEDLEEVGQPWDFKKDRMLFSAGSFNELLKKIANHFCCESDDIHIYKNELIIRTLADKAGNPLTDNKFRMFQNGDIQGFILEASFTVAIQMMHDDFIEEGIDEF